MMYPKNIVGPRIDQGDLVSLIFDGAELTFRLPVVPNNPHNANLVHVARNFCEIDTKPWELTDQNQLFIPFATQSWRFEDESLLIDVAASELFVGIVEVSNPEKNNFQLLSFKHFEDAMLAWAKNSFSNQLPKDVSDLSSHALKEIFGAACVERKSLDWLTLQVSHVEGARPSKVLIIPLNDRFIMTFGINLSSLHYPDIKNPYSEETLKQFEFDLFDEFLSHVDLRYSPETIATISALKTK